jgi:hypothetical protein
MQALLTPSSTLLRSGECQAGSGGRLWQPCICLVVKMEGHSFGSGVRDACVCEQRKHTRCWPRRVPPMPQKRSKVLQLLANHEVLAQAMVFAQCWFQAMHPRVRGLHLGCGKGSWILTLAT